MAIARAAGPNVDAAGVDDRLVEAGDIGAVAAGPDLGGQQGLGAFATGGAALPAVRGRQGERVSSRRGRPRAGRDARGQGPKAGRI